jgi:hypothetical protein
MVFLLVRAVMYQTYFICLWPAGWNLDGILVAAQYLTIYPFQLREKWPSRVILESQIYSVMGNGHKTSMRVSSHLLGYNDYFVKYNCKQCYYHLILFHT